jgi:hypothetical protein
VSTSQTKALIAGAVRTLQDEVPSLRQLKLVMKLELQARGGDAPIWRIELPGARVDRDVAGDARVEIAVPRPQFNELAREGRMRDWAAAYERGHVRVGGDPAVLKLMASVIQRHLTRARA